ncbi:hypothetical protein K437DRAFT_249526 [Tilletiaria anomala UBC 951]|uniref:Exocyst complex component SEC5 n=1 Tax=Tilletiaria anomala (strain ATCC 24038 / CBS 436.72 / UBC 951) TaxID=1037660 RepID=A0A066VRV8_TILAU|nr:uncharacterized protein K437DRAFT_249526 [Tilletiaria anomala UBC 951]KDN41534.1 hypothetical protein K437DRAFT_249526 [Tilletiaria anomala UBC 951]
MSLEVDEATILKAYGLKTIEPDRWHNTNEGKDGDSNDVVATFDGELDPLNLRPRMPNSNDFEPELRPQLSLSSKAFDAKVFLSQVHPDATFADLSRGVIHLKESIEQRSEALKVLVQDNFDRFVAVKATNDGVFREMKELDHGPLKEGQEYGTKELREVLGQASAKADQVFMPVLENNLKAGKLRSTLGVFERSKFFFNLPASLRESVESGRYDVALRDYRKGKYLMSSRPGQLLALPSTADALGLTSEQDAAGGNHIDEQGNVQNSKLQAQQKRVFDKVWGAAQRVMTEMEQRLFAMLRDPKRSVDEQLKTIEVVLEMSPSQDPVSVYLESERTHVRALMTKTYDICVSRVDASRAVASASTSVTDEAKERVQDLQTCLREVRRSDPNFEAMAGGAAWKNISIFVRRMCEVMLQNLPTYWRVVKHYLDGRFVKKGNASTGVNDRIASQCKSWALESINEFCSLLSHFFTLTDISILVRRPLSPLPDWVPIPCSCSTAATFMRTTLEDLGDTIAEMEALNIPGSSNPLQSLLVNARFRFTEVLCRLWQEDAQQLSSLEEWTLDPVEPSTTLFINDIAAFHKSNARLAYLVAGGRDSLPGTTRPKESLVKSEFVSRIKASFVDAFRISLEGMVTLAFSDYNPVDAETTTSRKVVGGSNITIDVREPDTRILLSITNVSQIQQTLIPSLLKQFSEAFQTSVTTEQKQLKELAQRVDRTLFEDFVKRKGTSICKILKDGILHSGIDWRTLPKPTEVNPFIYDALLAMVQVHAQIRAVAKQLVDRAITNLLDQLARETLKAFQQVQVFGMGGMLQATLEIEFIHQTLSPFVSPSAEQTLKQLYETISERYQRKSPDETELLKQELETVKKTLVASRKATALQFLCFRRTRSSKEKEESSSSRSKERRE